MIKFTSYKNLFFGQPNRDEVEGNKQLCLEIIDLMLTVKKHMPDMPDYFSVWLKHKANYNLPNKCKKLVKFTDNPIEMLNKTKSAIENDCIDTMRIVMMFVHDLIDIAEQTYGFSILPGKHLKDKFF